jgi:hypothetical protein
MQPEQYKDVHAAMLGSRGGIRRRERLSAQERSAISSLAARARWHPREFQAAKERAQQVLHIVQQELKKDSRQLPLI